jgi:hypothetical protein
MPRYRSFIDERDVATPMPGYGRNRQNPAEEMLARIWQQHRGWTDDQWFDYLIAEINKPQEDNLNYGCVEFCIVEALDHMRRYWGDNARMIAEAREKAQS